MATAATALATTAVAAVVAALQHQQHHINTIHYHLCVQTAVAVGANRIGKYNSRKASKPY